MCPKDLFGGPFLMLISDSCRSVNLWLTVWGTTFYMGIVGTTLLGIFLFHEKLSVPQVICVILIVVGIAGLKLLAKD